LVTDGVKEWLAVQQKRKATSTYRGYKSKAQSVLDKWPHRRIADIPKSEIELFQAELLGRGLSPKTVNDTFTVIRGVWATAFEDGIIRTNPLDRIANAERDEIKDYADPFTLKELDRIQGVKTMRQQDINMIMFACWCGLSVSELIALSWDDVDTVEWVIHV